MTTLLYDITQRWTLDESGALHNAAGIRIGTVERDVLGYYVGRIGAVSFCDRNLGVVAGEMHRWSAGSLARVSWATAGAEDES